RFTPAEAAEFLNRVMGLNLSPADIAALDTRTEGWIAGLQLAAISMRGLSDTAGFIKSFTGSHHFVLDYLVDEVLGQQTASVQTFLLRTSILDRLCGPLCDAVLQGDHGRTPAAPGQETVGGLTSSQMTLEYLERANLFTVPLDHERRWYRYHHLFAELLRQRLQQSDNPAEYHIRASQWHEDNDLPVEAFRHAAAANDLERTERLIAEGGIPLHLLGVVTSIIDWLDSLPKTALDARPWLWVRSGTSMLMAGQITGVEERLQAAEAALAAGTQSAGPDDKARDLMGQIASVRATLAILHYEPEAAIIQSRRAVEFLQPNNSPSRTRAIWTLGYAYQLQGDRAAARQVFGEAMAIRQTPGNVFFTILATTGLGQIQELDNQLHQAAESYRRSLHLFGDKEPPNASEEFLGLARICYEWNDLDTAEQYARQSIELARQYDPAIDRVIMSEVFMARLKLTRGDVAGAAARLAEAQHSAQQRNFTLRLLEIAAVQVLVLLRQGDLAAAAQLARAHELPISQARVLLAQGDPATALGVLEGYRQQVEVRSWQDERLKAMVLQAVALRAHGEHGKAVQLLGEALALAEPGGFIRIFVDEGESMAQLLSEAAARGMMPDYTARLLAAFRGMTHVAGPPPQPPSVAVRPSSLVEPLSQRELEILKLITQGLSNREIGQRLFLALDTVKGHNRRIFDKLQVQSRTEAIARARELGLL
ncbi:MAG: LuxR family transcriptional regulator, partial [Planctomycetes bacterium]|nr:LuxR family transcriptional regulator [Planctomycetota bacterium]